MWTPETLADETIQELNLPNTVIQKCSGEVREKVLKQIEEELVRATNPRIWWQTGRNKVTTRPDTESDFEALLAEMHISRTDACWFLPDPGPNHPMPVYKTTVSVAQQVTQNSPYFEYYLVGTTFEWMIASTHHGQLIFFDTDKNYEE